MAGDSTTATAYHDATKHYFHRYARSLGYLDWATQPDPFRRYEGAPVVELPRPVTLRAPVPYSALYAPGIPAEPFSIESIGSFLRYSMGLSAWKQYGTSRWALRVNPSSGNLHPTEAYVVWDGSLHHYAPREHLLERRCSLAVRDLPATLLVGLTSIHWREAWKYGERAFRYCQHDAGHAIAALRLSAAMHGWRLRVVDDWTASDLATVLGTSREEDYEHAEREEPECVAVVSAGPDEASAPTVDRARLLDAAQQGRWFGRANRLSAERVEWPLIDAVTAATQRLAASPPRTFAPSHRRTLAPSHPRTLAPLSGDSAAEVILKRRSALGYDPRGVLRGDAFMAILERLKPGTPPWDSIGWSPQVHLALFIHRVQDLAPGIYAYVRDEVAPGELKAAMRSEFLWEPMGGDGLYLLAPIDTRATANRLSCNQEIAEDGFFSLGMLARFEENLRDHGDPFYRRLFWEAGMVGQVLYLEAEAAGARGTGIGCYFDDPVHELLGLAGHAWQSLYHFSMGLPVDDTRLTTEPGYEWEG